MNSEQNLNEDRGGGAALNVVLDPPDNINEWWEKLLAEHTANGISDANNGVFEWPYPDDSNDPQSEDENLAYKKGFDNRRRELGDKFKWA